MNTRAITTMISAYLIWSVLPLYLHLVNHVSAVEVLVHRAFWSIILLLILLTFMKRLGILLKYFTCPKTLLHLFGSAIFLTCNWGFFVYAIVIGDVLSTSMAYFICPIMTMAVALVIYGERLGSMQWFALIFATLAIVYRIVMAGDFPWLAILISLSWTIYIMFQKRFPLPVYERLSIETIVIFPFILIGFWWWKEAQDYTLIFSGINNKTSWLLIGCGLVTIAPLFLFNSAVGHMQMKLVSILQYIVPSISFLSAVFILGEPLNQNTFISFAMIWVAVAFFLMGQYQKK